MTIKYYVESFNPLKNCWEELDYEHSLNDVYILFHEFRDELPNDELRITKIEEIRIITAIPNPLP